MTFTSLVAWSVGFAAGILLWAKLARLDLGFRTPSFDGVWEWIGYFVLWSAAGWGVTSAQDSGAVEDLPEWMLQLTLAQAFVLFVLLGPLIEELLLRGALFSALFRRWGPAAAVLVPSLMLGLLYLTGDFWFAATSAGAAVILAVIRWRSGSIWIPLALQTALSLVLILGSMLYGSDA
jgi:membrane protease YdiL (CAAX protease family)